MRRIMLAAALATAIAGCSTMEDGGAGSADAMDMTPEAREAYVTMAGSSDLYEIQSGQLTRERTERPEIRQFGQTLVDHHTQTSQQLMAAARAAGMNPPPPTLLPMHQRMLAELQQASGTAFDQLFARQQVQAHEMALALHRNYASNGDTPALRTAASGAVPVITQHLERARQLD